MSRYAFLLLPSFNRVYAAASAELARAELEVFATALDGRVDEIGTSDIAGVPYITFDCDGLTERDAARLGNLSSLYALFEVTGSDTLRPVAAPRLDRLDDDLLTILKYQGKTNEQFTKLLLNVTLLSSRFAAEMLTRKVSVLDPLCGRGTTLNQALMYGFDAYGMDIDKRDIEAYSAFIRRWLKDKRLKHQAEFIPVRREKKLVARRLQASFAASKDDYKAGDVQRLDVVLADASRAPEFFKASSADLVVADLPYGIQHGSTAGPGLARSPLELLARCAPGWAKVLRSGGALGISWNTFVASRDDAADELAAAGLEVLDDGPYLKFRHRVDQAINRDILVAWKP
ncbi:MAG: SAM-dependent methyltransferase [Streptosporangiales bacterium]|nr:SAM-dependent methyltransferase [Streptosporangiales bacterium]